METQMQINGAAVRALREKQSWSQEHLAGASGLSVRTIQRVETENLASPETRLALAAALDVPVAVLAPAPLATSDPPRASSSGLLQKAFLGLGLAFAVGFALVALFNLVSGIMPRG